MFVTRSVSKQELDELGPEDSVFVQTRIWGPPEPGRYIGKRDDGFLSVELSAMPGKLYKAPADSVFKNWTHSLEDQLDIADTGGENSTMSSLAHGLKACLDSEYLPNSNFFDETIRSIQESKGAVAFAELLEKLFPVARPNGNSQQH
jgi:hypothetical protein